MANNTIILAEIDNGNGNNYYQQNFNMSYVADAADGRPWFNSSSVYQYRMYPMFDVSAMPVGATIVDAKIDIITNYHIQSTPVNNAIFATSSHDFSTGPLATTFNGLGLIKKIETGVQFSDGNFGGHLHPDVNITDLLQDMVDNGNNTFCWWTDQTGSSGVCSVQNLRVTYVLGTSKPLPSLPTAPTTTPVVISGSSLGLSFFQQTLRDNSPGNATRAISPNPYLEAGGTGISRIVNDQSTGQTMGYIVGGGATRQIKVAMIDLRSIIDGLGGGAAIDYGSGIEVILKLHNRLSLFGETSDTNLVYWGSSLEFSQTNGEWVGVPIPTSLPDEDTFGRRTQYYYWTQQHVISGTNAPPFNAGSPNTYVIDPRLVDDFINNPDLKSIGFIWEGTDYGKVEFYSPTINLTYHLPPTIDDAIYIVDLKAPFETILDNSESAASDFITGFNPQPLIDGKKAITNAEIDARKVTVDGRIAQVGDNTLLQTTTKELVESTNEVLAKDTTSSELLTVLRLISEASSESLARLDSLLTTAQMTELKSVTGLDIFTDEFESQVSGDTIIDTGSSTAIYDGGKKSYEFSGANNVLGIKTIGTNPRKILIGVLLKKYFLSQPTGFFDRVFSVNLLIGDKILVKFTDGTIVERTISGLL